MTDAVVVVAMAVVLLVVVIVVVVSVVSVVATSIEMCVFVCPSHSPCLCCCPAATVKKCNNDHRPQVYP